MIYENIPDDKKLQFLSQQSQIAQHLGENKSIGSLQVKKREMVIPNSVQKTPTPLDYVLSNLAAMAGAYPRNLTSAPTATPTHSTPLSPSSTSSSSSTCNSSSSKPFQIFDKHKDPNNQN